MTFLDLRYRLINLGDFGSMVLLYGVMLLLRNVVQLVESVVEVRGSPYLEIWVGVSSQMHVF